MKIFLSFFLYSSLTFAECAFKADIKKVASLSGPMTVLFSELGLLKSPAIAGISHYHPVDRKGFSGRRFPGGIFLAPSVLEDLSGAIVFYDESRELKKILETQRSLKAIEVKTRNLLPLDSIERSIELVLPILSGCESSLSVLRKKAQMLQSELIKKVPSGMRVYFYLGKIADSRFPEMLIVQDGAVKLLLQEKRIITYPSPLSYVNWSSKILQESGPSTLHVGIVDSGDSGKIEITKKKNTQNIFFPGALVPGLYQLRAFHYWANSL